MVCGMFFLSCFLKVLQNFIILVFASNITRLSYHLLLLVSTYQHNNTQNLLFMQTSCIKETCPAFVTGKKLVQHDVFSPDCGLATHITERPLFSFTQVVERFVSILVPLSS